MQLTREINRLLIGLLLAFLVMVGAATYWAVVGADTILQRDDNPRLVLDEQAIRRGSLYDRDGTLLAESVAGADGTVQRRYQQTAMHSATGYFSFRYGVGGAEAAYDAILRGDTLPDDLTRRFNQDVLHRPQVGSDVQLTLHHAVQQAAVDAMGDYTGAVVVLGVPDGAVWALVSLPTFDPNQLNAQWQTLVDDPGRPFFNRALQGRYQSGGLLQTPLIAAAVLTGMPLQTVVASAAMPVMVDDVRLRCALTPPHDDLTRLEGYAYGCPRPFDLLLNDLNAQTLTMLFDAFRLRQMPTLAGFVPQPPNATPSPTPETTASPVAQDLRADALGQGVITVNPLGMAMMAGAMLNEGNMPPPHALFAIQAPDAGTWQTVDQHQVPVAMLTAEAARRVRDLMIDNVQSGAIAAAQYDDLTIGGHVATAIAGDDDRPLSWFIGFVATENGHDGFAVAVVLEDVRDGQAAARIGSEALAAAYAAHNQN